MEQVAAFPEESWQHVVCRICGHPFTIAVEDAGAVPITFCQTCTLLVEWFGQDADAPLTPEPSPPPSVRAEALPKRASKTPRKARQQAQLGSLLERWGDLWRGSEEQE